MSSSLSKKSVLQLLCKSSSSSFSIANGVVMNGGSTGPKRSYFTTTTTTTSLSGPSSSSPAKRCLQASCIHSQQQQQHQRQQQNQRFKSSVSPLVDHDDDDDDDNDTDNGRLGNTNNSGHNRTTGHSPLDQQTTFDPIMVVQLLQQQQQQQQQEQPNGHAKSTTKDEKSTISNDKDHTATDVTSIADENNNEQQDQHQEEFVSPSELVFTGNATIPVTSHLHIYRPGVHKVPLVWPVFRMMDENGTFRNGRNDGYHFESDKDDESATTPSTSTTTDFVPPTSQYSNDPDDFQPLSTLRSTLRESYPLYTDEIYRNGFFLPSKHDYADTSSKDTLVRLHRQLVRLRQMDTILQNAQRQGRISFYMTCRGEEAIHFGSASALEPQDTILAQYREQGLLMWRGFTLQQFSDQCFSNEADLGKGRQMPVHYGSKALNYQTISSPLGTQIPQASGAAYRLKLQNKDAVSICFFGEGCTSTTDFHSGLNFAATLGCPVIFFCRNNGYAISTSVKDQYAGDGVISRAPAYGMAGIRVDGSDPFAVHSAVREARSYAVKNKAPVLIEAMTYRQGHHSTSDDSLRYRSVKEVEHFADNADPLHRLEAFLKRHYDMTDEDFQTAVDEEKMAVLDAMRNAERKPKPSLEELFEDVYQDMPPNLQGQQNELYEHIAKYPNHYK